MKDSSLFTSMFFMETEKGQDYEEKINAMRGKIQDMQS